MSNINICGFKYSIHFKETENMNGLYGMTNSRNQTITLDESLSSERHSEVFLHEVLHAVFDGMGIVLPLEQEEDLVNRIGLGLAPVIQSKAWVKNFTKSTERTK